MLAGTSPAPAAGRGDGRANSSIHSFTMSAPFQFCSTIRMPYAQSTVFRGHSRAVSSVKFSPDSRFLGSSSGDKTVRVWQLPAADAEGVVGEHAASASAPAPAAPVQTLTGHAFGISDCTWSSDSRHLCSASDDKTLNLYDVASGRAVRSFVGHSSYVCCVAFHSPADNMLASGSFDESVMMWDTRTGAAVRTIPAHAEPVTGVEFGPTGQGQLVSGSYDGVCRIWDVGSGQMLASLPKFERDAIRHTDSDKPPVSGVRFSPNGRFVLVSSLDSTMRLWDWKTQQCVKTYRGHTNAKYCLSSAFSTVGAEKLVVGASEDGRVYVWGLQKKDIVQTLDGHQGIDFCAWSMRPAMDTSLCAHEFHGIVRILRAPHRYGHVGSLPPHALVDCVGLDGHDGAFVARPTCGCRCCRL
jgi:COMPASS component SWD3